MVENYIVIDGFHVFCPSSIMMSSFVPFLLHIKMKLDSCTPFVQCKCRLKFMYRYIIENIVFFRTCIYFARGVVKHDLIKGAQLFYVYVNGVAILFDKNYGI